MTPRSMPSLAHTALTALACAAIPAGAWADDIVPVDGQVILTSATLVPGAYVLPNGLIIGASNVDLDLNGAVLVGDGSNGFGVQCNGFDNVSIRNGIIRGYFYGARVENARNVRLVGNDLSNNWADPASRTSTPPFLNINAPPDLGDRTNLGGGLFMRNVSAATVLGNVAHNGGNGIDLYFGEGCVISGNDCSDNTGWGIHLYSSTQNTVASNVADRCIRANLSDSAGMLLVFGSSRNSILGNSFTHSGDGFFIGNENGCPSNDNLIQNNDGSHAGANAFEATFSSGNQFIENVADNSNYGFWLGYSHSGNVLRGNRIRANNTAGIEIEHGQANTIDGNLIVYNGHAGIVLRTDGIAHFPPDQYPCLALPDPGASSGYTIVDNRIHGNFGTGLVLINTTDSDIVNNLIGGPFANTASSNGDRNTWNITPTPGTNIVGGPTLGGNWWSNYAGQDTNSDGIGDTLVPYVNGGMIASPGDNSPLIGNPDLGPILNPRVLCDRSWRDIGRNRRTNNSTFETANGTHFATNGVSLLLLEGANSGRLSQFDPATGRYAALAALTDSVQDGGDFQWGGTTLYFATVGLGFDRTTGAGNGSRLHQYNSATNAWSVRAPTMLNGQMVCNEALAHDRDNNRIFATIVNVRFPANGGDESNLRRLAIYSPTQNTWLGVTAQAPDAWSAGSEAEWLDGRVYVWRGGFNGGAVNGSDSYLDVYDTALDRWSRTPTLQNAGIVPGFRSGAFDVWGVSLAADALRRQVFVLGGEANRVLYVFDVASQTWATGPNATYDGGWGASIEFVAQGDRLYQIDGRNSGGVWQGTAVMARTGGDLNCDGVINAADAAAMALSLVDPQEYRAQFPACDPSRGDLDCNGTADGGDVQAFVRAILEP